MIIENYLYVYTACVAQLANALDMQVVACHFKTYIGIKLIFRSDII